MPPHLAYTNPPLREANGGLFINWALPSGKEWIYVGALVPALLVFILFFVAIEITQYVYATL
jgi:hypothetical protein